MGRNISEKQFIPFSQKQNKLSWIRTLKETRGVKESFLFHVASFPSDVPKEHQEVLKSYLTAKRPVATLNLLFF